MERARGVLSRGATGTEYVLAREVLRQTERLAAVAALCADRERKWNAGEVAIVTVWDLRAALGGTNA